MPGPPTFQQSARPSPESSFRVAFDIGGTFTDVVIAGPGAAFFRFKILTLPERVGEDVRACIESARREAPGNGVGALVHGTTVAANTVLERTGARTGLVTTAGFRDELEIRRLARPGVYDVAWERTPPLVPRRLRLEVGGRLTASGAEDRPLDRAGMGRALRRLAGQDIEALAIAFVHAYLNPAHEQAALALARAVLPGIPICISSDVLPEVREYERTSTTVLNAYLMPAVGRYLDRLEGALGDYPVPLRIMQSNGGVMSARRTRERPVGMIESGPAAGVLAAAGLARALSLARVVAFDMGGTTAKACLIENGTPLETAEGEVGAGINLAGRLSKGAGYALRVPAFDIAEVGAGGGSLAWADPGGALRVGPRSAGAVPGPAAYGRGGTEPTITDANVFLGYMSPEAIAGRGVPIDVAAARAAFEPLSSRLGLGLDACVHGVHQVANAAMSRAIRAVTTERGRDPRQFGLIAFGGSGPIHALSLADSLGITRCWVPLHPGLFSAIGLLLADERYDAVQSVPGELAAIGDETLARHLERLAARALEESGAQRARARVSRYVDLRYGRQASELTLPVPDAQPRGSAPSGGLVPALTEAFHREHERTYGYRRESEPVSLVSLRVRIVVPSRATNLEALSRRFRERAVPVKASTRKAYFGSGHGWLLTRVLGRGNLLGAEADGPLVIEEFDTTVVVPPGWTARLDAFGNVALERAEGRGP